MGNHNSRRIKSHDWDKVITKKRLSHLYTKLRLTQKEIGEMLGCSFQPIARALREYGIPIRDKSDKQLGRKSGNENPMWKGQEASYKAFHQRLYYQYGSPKYCSICQTTDINRRYDWHNKTGNYHKLTDYVRVCRACHNSITHGKNK